MRAIQGALSTWPIVYVVLFVGMIATAPMGNLSHIFPTLFVVHGLTILLGMGTVLWFAFDAGTDDDLDPTQKLLWILILMMGNLLALPLYFWMRIQPRDG